ncbi:hypothetical protein MSAN_00096300 [Mycena sanguinolenta]|uniref:Uncharacterized protein n=1 Tax=Mycena sanguinolenta TaxID=230812 RepID=A0A8H6ZJS1_9AGAR|nr:hypothetical protein MSAN_00096300 [Mycena sanguinolenta]
MPRLGARHPRVVICAHHTPRPRRCHSHRNASPGLPQHETRQSATASPTWPWPHRAPSTPRPARLCSIVCVPATPPSISPMIDDPSSYLRPSSTSIDYKVRCHLPPHGPAPTPNAPTTRRRIFLTAPLASRPAFARPQALPDARPSPREEHHAAQSGLRVLTDERVHSRATVRFTRRGPRQAALDAVGQLVGRAWVRDAGAGLGVRAPRDLNYLIHLRIGAEAVRRTARRAWDRDREKRLKRVRRAELCSSSPDYDCDHELGDSRRFGSGRRRIAHAFGVRQCAARARARLHRAPPRREEAGTLGYL